MKKQHKKITSTSEPPRQQQARDPFDELQTSLESLRVDLECIRELFSTTLPLLKVQDAQRLETAKSITNEINERKKADPRKPLVIEKLQALLRNLQKLNRAQMLFRHHAVVMLVSRYDQFLSEILSVTLGQHPDWMKSSSKTVSYREVIELKSLDALIQQIVANEVLDLMWGSHEEQVQFLDDKLKIGIREHFRKWPEFIEVTERRNLFVHTGGRVNDTYLTKCAKHNAPVGTAKAGDLLNVSDSYFEEAFRCIYELGIRIGQGTLRRLFPTRLEPADAALNGIGYSHLEAGDWTMAEFVFEFALGLPAKLVSQGDFPLLYLINLCIARKYLKKDIDELLKRHDWASLHPKYLLAITVLRDDFEKAAKLMRTGAVKESVTIDNFHSWPLFREFRTTEQFRASYRKLFRKDFVPSIPREEGSHARIASDQSIEGKSADSSNSAAGPQSQHRE